MRYSPAAAALALLASVTASTGHSAPPVPLDPRAAALVAQGREDMQVGRVNAAVDSFESALTIQPGHLTIYLNLGEATRKQGMHGKALHYYREVLKLDPDNAHLLDVVTTPKVPTVKLVNPESRIDLAASKPSSA